MRADGAVRRQTIRGNATSQQEARVFNYEAALLECAAGHRIAIARIYADEGAHLRDVAQRIVRSRDRAEDVVHDAFAQILRDARTFDPSRGSARAWVYTIVRNAALKNLQTAGREFPIGEDKLISICDRQQQCESCPAEDLALRTCLDDLEPRRRASLILAIVDGRTHAEIADYLGVPIGTVKAWIRRELIALRQRLG